MKFIARHKAKGVKGVSVGYAWSGRNLFLHVAYTLTPRRFGATVGTAEIDGHLELWFTTKTVCLTIRFIPETDKERRLLKKCWVHVQSSDDVDASIMLMPSLTEKEWDGVKEVDL